jgi:hypothetical protein
MLKTLRVTLLLGTGLALTAGSALALQTTVTQVDKNSNGTTWPQSWWPDWCA